MDRRGYRREARNMLGWIFGWYRDKYYNYVTPDGFQIHHIDGDWTNNSLDNLAILTVEEHRAIHEGDNKINGKISNKKSSRPVLCVETGVIYESIREANRQTGISYQHICSVCRGRRKIAGGYHWEYANDG